MLEVKKRSGMTHDTSDTPETIGRETKSIPIELSTRFLEHFSESLYSSPQKAFEELVSNSWDAGADRVDIHISIDLGKETATMCVIDNGSSMNIQGLEDLWTIAFSPKKNVTELYGRPVIGKFGIGKLATYVLADKLTYICKASDGIIRRVTMDYSKLKPDAQSEQERLMSQVSLPLFEVDEIQVNNALINIDGGKDMLRLIRQGFPPPDHRNVDPVDEFCAPVSKLEKPSTNTWTLVVLSDLKQTGRNLKIGTLRRMLQAALPIGTEMAISLNGKLLSSSKLDRPTLKEWIIGPDLELQQIEFDEGEVDGSDADTTAILSIHASDRPAPHVEIPGIGKVTGRVHLFEERISGGKSDQHGASNGFHVNVLGRVVNQHDTSFGEANLSHAAWARFRMTVRADGLNDHLTTNREQFTECRQIRIFRSFLRKAFNKARQYYDSDEQSAMSHGGDELVKTLGVISLKPLRNIVGEVLSDQVPVPGLFDESGVDDKESEVRSWRKDTADNIGNALGDVRFEPVGDDSFVKYRVSDRSMVVNRHHPFVVEHSRTKAEKELLRTIAMVSFLTDVYVLDLGVEPAILESMRNYRDRLLRFRALQRRQSGTHIAKILDQVKHDSENSRRLEAILSDALRYLGFEVKDLAKPGQPEGVASAYTYPTRYATEHDAKPPLYKFTFDAKSTKHDTAKTGNIDLAAIIDHRKKHEADYALVVAPGFSGEAIGDRCVEARVTPMTASDLGRLLKYTVQYGAIDLITLKEVFDLFRPDEVAQWVGSLGNELQNNRKLTLDVFLKALMHMKGDVPDAIPAGTFTYICKTVLDVIVRETDVLALARGLEILVPDIVGVENDKIVVNTSVERVASAVATQLEDLYGDERPQQ